MGGLCAFIFPGLGHLVLGKPVQALFWFVLIVIGYVAMVVPGIVLHAISVIDAARADRRNAVRVISEGVRRGKMS